MKKIPKKLSGSALLISLLILTGIFIVAFGAGYLSFFNSKNSDTYQQAARARLAAEIGVERMKWELGKNNFDLNTQCGSRILETKLADGYYYLKCALDDYGLPKIQSVGVFKNSSMVLNTDICYDVNVECRKSCLIGSLCGGGVLFSKDPLIISAPAACLAVDGSGCDNSFATPDTNSLAWDDSATSSLVSAIDENDGRVNAALLTGTNYAGAQFCSNLSVNGRTDWYLPAKNELNTMLRNSNYCTEDVQGPEPTLCSHGTSTSPIIGGFVNGGYLSSTENNADSFFSQDFSAGAQATSTKSVPLLFRCIRRPI